jgi:NADH-quinone oxidoreductase subunit N
LILVKRVTGSDRFESFNGLAKKNPFLAFTVTIAMLSLAGIPLTAGFMGKFMMFNSALTEYHIWLVVIAVANAIIGMFYYLRVIVAMYFRDSDCPQVSVSPYFNFVLGFSAVVTIILGVFPALISNLL